MNIKSLCISLGTAKSPALQSANALMGQEGDRDYERNKITKPDIINKYTGSKKQTPEKQTFHISSSVTP